MAGLTNEGFEPETLENIETRIKSRLDAINPGFDFSPESPDGQLINIMAQEIYQAWVELDLVYHSYDPSTATGQALRNIGQITGIPYGISNSSSAYVSLTGTAGTIVPMQSVVEDALGNQFLTTSAAVIPSSVLVVALNDGPTVVTAGTITTIATPVTGWTGVSQAADGTIGKVAMTESEYRNIRSRTVMRNYRATEDVIQSRLLELGIVQAKIINNDTATTLGDGTPPQSIHVIIGEVGSVTDTQIAEVILKTKGLVCPTHGTTTVALVDEQGVSHDIKFTKAIEVPIFIDMNITFLSEDIAGAEENIKEALVVEINRLLAGEDVIWSRLFGIITPFAKAQINTLTIGKSLGTLAATNIALTDTEFASCATANINIVVV